MTNDTSSIDALAATPYAEFPKNYFNKQELTKEGAESIAKNWVEKFNKAVSSKDPQAFDDLVDNGGFWRDVIAFTNDYRSMGKEIIRQAAADRLATVEAKDAQFEDSNVCSPYEDLTFILAAFNFNSKLGPCTGISHLVKTQDGDYKAFIMFTALDGVHGHTEQVNHNRVEGTHNGQKSYDEIRAEQLENPNPDVVIIGAGHGGLQTAAHLKAFGLSPLIVDREKRVGDNWRTRYSSLSLHDPCYGLHFAYMPFPATWPKYPSAGKLAHWLEHYAETLELNIWTQSELIPSKTSFDSKTNQWTVTINHEGREERTFTVSHVVLSTGTGGGKPWLPPKAPGQDNFKGRVIHSSEVSGGSPFKGEKVLIIGTGSSGHDLALDCYRNGADVTMLQRSPTYIMSIKNGMKHFVESTFNEDTHNNLNFVDRTAEATPKAVVKLHHQRTVKTVAELDKELLDGLEKVGFRTYLGPDRTGLMFLSYQRNGGYYYNSGASTAIAEGKINIQPGEIAKFTENEVHFKDGNVMRPDSVVFCTGYTGFQDSVREILGEEYVKMMNPIWGLDEEVELKSVFRDCGIPNTYFMVGALNIARFNSRMIALQILAQRDGVFGERYTIEKQKSRSLTNGNGH
jgi:cation diffusion facilitator CzcD-associated flavoprotein CzcO